MFSTCRADDIIDIYQSLNIIIGTVKRNPENDKFFS